MTTRAGVAITIAAAAIVVAIAVAAASGSTESRQGSPGEAVRSASVGGKGQLPRRRPLGIVGRTLARLDPLALKPRDPRLKLGEYHETWSFSPDRSRLALGMGSPGVPVCGAGVCIVDVASMRITEDIDAPIAAEAVGWVSRRRVVAVLQSGQVIVANPVTGRTIRRDDLGVETFGPPSAATPDGFAVLVGGDPARLVAFDAQGRLREAELDQIRLGDEPPLPAEQAGLAVDRARNRALVLAAAAPAAEVDLQTMDVSYHPIIIPAAERARASIRCAVWLGRSLVAVSGEDVVSDHGTRALRVRERPAGVTVLDTETWSPRTANRRATRAARVAGRLLIWRSSFARSGRGVGLRIYTRNGQRLLAHRFGHEKLNVQAAGRYAYAFGSDKLRVVRVRPGRVVHRSDSRRGGATRLLRGRLGSGYRCGR